jgi:outer membrane autotransporter protein
VTARGSLGWRHAFGDTAPTTTLAFAGGSPFSIAGAPIAKSAAVVEAGLDFKLSNAATLGLSYGGQFGSGLKDHSARVHLNVAF